MAGEREGFNKINSMKKTDKEKFDQLYSSRTKDKVMDHYIHLMVILSLIGAVIAIALLVCFKSHSTKNHSHVKQTTTIQKFKVQD